MLTAAGHALAAVGHALAAALPWILYFLWAAALLAAPLLTWLGLGGNFAIVGLGLLHGLVTGFDPVGWRLLLFLLGLVVLGEVVESLLGTLYVARRGASRWGVLGAFAGGLLGAAVGSSVAPLVGTILGSIVGSWAGAVLGEYWRQRRLAPSLRVGGHAFVGKMAALLVKQGIGVGMIVVLLRRGWPV